MLDPNPAVSILIVDDQPRNIVAMQAALARVDCQLVTAQSGREALKHVLAQDFAVILLDVQMPGLDGFETTSLIRARERSRSTPIIFLTAFDDTEARVQEAYRLGGIDYLLKPIDTAILRSKVTFFVELYRKSTALEQRTAELTRVTAQLVEREHQVRAFNTQLEARVLERTAALEAALIDLDAEAGERLRTEASLRDLEHAAAGRTAALAEVSRVLVEHFSDHRPILTRVAQIAAVTTQSASVIQLMTEDGDQTPAGALSLAVDHADPWVRTELARVFSSVSTQSSSPWLDLSPALLEAHPLMDCLSVPMLTQTATIGVLSLGRFGPNALPFSESDRRFCADMATRVGLAIENARLYARARAAIGVRDNFLTIAAHELKTPLTAIQGYSQLLAHQLEEGLGENLAALHRSTHMIEDRTRHLARLVEQILDVSQLVAARLQLNRSDADLVGILKTVVGRFQARHATHEFRLHLRNERPRASVDPPRLEQVLTNLIDNAVRYSPDGGPIDITIEQEEQLVLLSIRDRGLGISEDQRVHIFERFHRAHAADNRSGMGLGLHISHEIVMLHGGQITASFPADGGSQFTVQLPRASDAAA